MAAYPPPDDEATPVGYRRYWGYYNRPYSGCGCIYTILVLIVLVLVVSLIFGPIWAF